VISTKISDFIIPDNWSIVKLGEFCVTTSGGTPSRNRNDFFGGDIPWLKSGELNNGIIKEAEEKITEAALASSNAKIIPKGTLLIALYGATVGKLGILGIDAAINQAICAIFTSEGISNKFLFWYLKSFRNELLNSRKGGAQPNISQGLINNLQIPLPPLREQHRIVAKIEEHFSDLDNGIENLKKAQAQLKIYRQAVLKYAFEGKLTAEWRQQNTGKLESAELLLKKIKIERENSHNRQLEEWRQAVQEWEKDGKKGKKPVKPKPPKELPPLTEAELSELPTLPEGWGWVRLGKITENIQIGPFGTQLHKSDYIANGIPIINPAHIKDSKIIANKNLTIPENKYRELQNYVLRKGDIIMGRRGEMGRCALVTDRESGWLCGTGSLFIRPTPLVNSQYLNGVLSSREIKSFLEREASGSTMSNLNLKILYRVPIPLPPFIEEQTQIVQEIESRLSVCDKLEETIEESLKKAELLRQSILKKAFEGKLVPQDPNDEPAEKLLARIRQEKEFTLKKINQKGV